MKKSLLNFLGSDAGFGFNNNSAYYIKDTRIIILDCGMTVFNELRKKVNLTEFDTVDIVITHLHPDHAGSLGQLIMYLWYRLNKKANILTECVNIEKYLEIIGVDRKIYNFKKDKNFKFIRTEHVPELDSYGVVANLNGKRIIYTGDTATLKPFYEEMNKADELYVDVSKNGGVHIKIDEIVDKLKEFKFNRWKCIFNAYRRQRIYKKGNK